MAKYKLKLKHVYSILLESKMDQYACNPSFFNLVILFKLFLPTDVDTKHTKRHNNNIQNKMSPRHSITMAQCRRDINV